MALFRLLSDARLQAASASRSLAEAPRRETLPYPVFLGNWGTGSPLLEGRPTPKMNTRRLRQLSERPVPRAAINTIKKELSALRWDVRVKKHLTKQKKHERQIRIARAIFNTPNPDDSCRSFLEQLVEDSLVGDFASIERRLGDDPERPVWLYPVDGATIQIYLNWDGDPESPRYAQVPLGNAMGVDPIDLTSDELVYVIDNKRTSTPFGFSPLEAAAVYIDWLLQVQTFAAKSAMYSVPKKLLNLGKTIDQNTLQTFRSYWKREVEGQGKYPIIGQVDSPSVLDLGPQNDDGLYLQWQQLLITIIAVSFDLNPQDLGMMFDSNRSNSVVQTASTKSGAIRPKARLFEEVFTRCVLEYVGFEDLEFVFLDVEPADVKTMATVYSTYIEADVYTLGQAREMLGEEPFGDERDDFTRSEYLAWLGEKYPAAVGPGTPKPNTPGTPGGKMGGTKAHGRSSGRPNGAVQRSE